MKTEIDYKKGILYVKLEGVLVGNKINKFECEIIPIIIGLESKDVIINLKGIELIDKRGIDSLIKISSLVNRFKGKLVLCELNEYLKNRFKNSDIFDYCFKSKNEETSKEVLKI